MLRDRFSLDKSIAAWRRTLEIRSSLETDDLDELEQHVRDQVASLCAGGHSRQAAFEITMREMGAPDVAASEYGKVYWRKQLGRGDIRSALAARAARARNYLAVAARASWRQKGSTLISVGGLAVGLAACLLVGMFADQELTFDRFHEQADEIYRVAWGHDLGGSALVPAHGARRLGELPEVDDYVRVLPASVVVRHDGEMHSEERFYYADGSFFKLFTFPLKAGDPSRVLLAPNTVVLSESASERYFGETSPIGETLELQNGTRLEVTGVARDAPSNSHLQFDFVASYETLGDPREWADYERGWAYQSWLYLAFTSESEALRFQDRVTAITDAGMESSSSAFGFSVRNMYFELQRLADIHLYPSPSGAVQPEGDVRYVYLFVAVGLLVLVIAAGNYVNLATARSLQRATEVGVRKALGARRGQVMGQFYCEAGLICCTAFAVSVPLAALTLPAFGVLHGTEIGMEYVGVARLVEVTGGLAALTALAGGLYPAAVLSRFSPLTTRQQPVTGRGRARRALVVFQFALSTILIVATVVVYAQMEYIRDARLGYSRSQIVKLPIPSSDENVRFTGRAGAATQRRGARLKQALLQTPGVEEASVSSGFPIDYVTGMVDLDGQPVEVHYISADPDYVRTMGLEMVAGATFSPEISNGVIINETMAHLWDLRDQVGHTLYVILGGREPRLLGIVADFHTSSLHHPIGPAVLLVEPDWFHSIVLRLHGEELSSALASVRETWERLVPDQPFEPEFLDARLGQLYGSEQRLARLIGAGSSFAILIACLGLLSLTALTIEQRKKEIGIRKVLGASVGSVVKLLTADVVRLAGIGFVVAAPAAVLIVRRWLAAFAYRTELAWWMIAAAGLLTVAVAVVTVSFQSCRAALADPVRSLRQE